MKKTTLLSFSCGLLLICMPARILCNGVPVRNVRVAINQAAETMRVKISGKFELIDAKSCAVIFVGQDLNATVKPQANSVLFGGQKVLAPRFIIRSASPDAITIDGRRFRDVVECIRKDNGALLLVNEVNLEDYVKGILYHEASHYWPMEVLRAQAVVCRTYALKEIQKNKTRDYDLTNDTYSQVYGGRTSERYRTNMAVDQTRGQVLMCQGALLPAYFHATCGGHTEDVSRMWNFSLAPLQGVACAFCKDSPHYNWHEVIELGELRQRLVNAKYSLGVIKQIMLEGKDPSGRILNVRIVSSRNEIVISAKDFRAAVGSNAIRSTNFTVEIAQQDVVFQGLGWGHGVGMCQWGAYFMAKDGATYENILTYYYPGATLENL